MKPPIVYVIVKKWNGTMVDVMKGAYTTIEAAQSAVKKLSADEVRGGVRYEHICVGSLDV